MSPIPNLFAKTLAQVSRYAVQRVSTAFMARAKPAVSGTLALAGLRAEVEILQDRWGVPQIFAANEPDLFFAQGYVHARDRLFQLELARRAGSGRLSELLGEDALGFDRLFHTLNFSERARDSIRRCPPETLETLASYAAGINAFIETGPRPPEFRLLRHRPEPWTPESTAAASLLVSWTLSSGFEEKLDGSSGGSPGGSNAWAVGPGRSATGGALLAGDPHLLPSIPNTFYEVGLYGGRYEVVGASFPGSPGIVIGHNRDIAWSITASLTDVQDLYAERFDPQDPTRYEYRGEWRQAEVRKKALAVRGRREPVVQTVRATLHGPVISDITGGSGTGGTAGTDLALRWAAPAPEKTIEAGLAADRARNWEEFTGALTNWGVPGQNFVYADRRGNIGRALAGPVPDRGNISPGAGPLPGWTGEHEWRGLRSYATLPRTFNPADGAVTSANEEPLPASDPGYIPGGYDPGYRKARIKELLRAIPEHTPGSFREMQADLYCAPAHAVAKRLGDLSPSGDLPPYLRAELAGWSGHLTPESRAGAVARGTLEELLRQRVTLSSDLDLPSTGRPEAADLRYKKLTRGLIHTLDDLPEAVLRGALQTTLSRLKSILGADPEKWSWGALHMAEFRHPLGGVRLLHRVFTRGPFPIGGDSNTLLCTGFRPGQEVFGPASTVPNYRFVTDTGSWENSWSVLVPGQSGNPASPSYDDQLSLWRKVRYKPLVFGRKMAETAATDRLLLRPG